MEDKLDIYRNSHTLWESELKRIERANLSPRNKELMMKFLNKLQAQGCKQKRVNKLSNELRRIISILKIDLDTVGKDDISRLMASLNTEKQAQNILKSSRNGHVYKSEPKAFSENTKSDYWKLIKRFYRWLYGKHTDLFDDIEIRFKLRTNIGNIITDEDIKKIVEKRPSIRDRSLLALSHETGGRIGEILNMRLGDIEKVGNAMKVRLDGKTGERKVIIVWSVPYLLRYLEVHPKKSDAESYLWLSDHKKNGEYEPILYARAKGIFKEAINNAGIKKRCNPHFFRHSRATINSKYLTDTQMCLFFGWDFGTRQIKTYVHASGRDVDDTILKMNGISPTDNEDKKMISCGLCRKENKATDHFCGKCGNALTLKDAIKHDADYNQQMADSIKLILEINNDPQMKARFENLNNVAISNLTYPIKEENKTHN